MGSVAYTWAKSTDSKSAAAGIGANESAGWQGFLNNHDVARDHGLSSFDVAHRFVASFVWNLPFGKGERFGGDASGFKQAVIGGWQMNGIYLWQGGFPISVFAADLGGVLDTFGTNRADIVGDIHSGGGTIEQWFNTAAFAQPALGAFGNSGRSILRGPGINNLDLGFFKNFTLPRGATPAVPGRGLQCVQPSAVLGRLAEHHLRELRGGHVRPTRSYRPAGSQDPLVKGRADGPPGPQGLAGHSRAFGVKPPS